MSESNIATSKGTTGSWSFARSVRAWSLVASSDAPDGGSCLMHAACRHMCHLGSETHRCVSLTSLAPSAESVQPEERVGLSHPPHTQHPRSHAALRRIFNLRSDVGADLPRPSGVWRPSTLLPPDVPSSRRLVPPLAAPDHPPKHITDPTAAWGRRSGVVLVIDAELCGRAVARLVE